MKITLLNTDDHAGGAAIACRRLLAALNKNGAEATMLVQASKSGLENVEALDKSWLQKKLSFARFVLERLWFWPFEKSKEVRFHFNIGRFGRDISKNPLVKQADILHLHWTNFGLLSVEGIVSKKATIWTLHDMWAFTGGCHYSRECKSYQDQCGNCEQFLKNPSGNDLSHQVWLRKQKAFQNLNLTVVACSDWLGQRAKKSSLFKDLKVVTIPNPIDTNVFRPIEKAEARVSLGLDPTKNYILFAAMSVTAPRKGFSYFIEALLAPLSTAPEGEGGLGGAELLVFGKATPQDFEDLPLKVNLLGQLSDIAQIVLAYSAATMFVIPSLEENLPNTIMESLACGTPAVGFEAGGIPEMIDHKKNGYLAAYQSADDLAKGMKWILEHPDYEYLCRNARQKVMENYTEKVVAEKYMALYRSITE